MENQNWTDHDLYFAQNLAASLGAGILRAGGVVEAVTKADGTPQTALDVKLNTEFREAVGLVHPGDVALGEEDLDEHRTPPAGARVWVCDPIDGTWLLPHGLPYTVVSLALVVNGQPQVGVICDPHTNRMFYAAEGQGAYLTDAFAVDEAGRGQRRLHVNKDDDLDRAVLALPGGAVPGIDVGGLHDWVIRSGSELVTVGSVAHDATLVASGFAAAAVYPYTSPWDMAAAAVIVREAGGRITALDGGPQRYDDTIRGAVVSNGAIHDQVVTLVHRYRID